MAIYLIIAFLHMLYFAYIVGFFSGVFNEDSDSALELQSRIDYSGSSHSEIMFFVCMVMTIIGLFWPIYLLRQIYKKIS